MKAIQLTVPIAAIAIAFSSFSAEAQDRAEARDRGHQNQGQQRSRSEASARPGGSRSDRSWQSQSRNQDRPQASRGGYSAYGYSGAVERSRGGQTRDSQSYGRSGSYAPRGDYNRGRYDDHRQNYGGGHNNGYSRYSNSYGYGRNYAYGYAGGYGYRGAYGYANGYAYSPYYYAPRLLAYRYAPRHYYGSGGHLSIYFGFGAGYLYGTPYSGRIYGYRAPASSYGDQYYGDIRLQVNPPDAEVYVDGYYAGIVDDFDGQYQRLALEAGPHKIEIGARGLQPQVFDVYVDPSRTVELRADLLR